MVWGETSKIGCGVSIYQRGQFTKKFVVCNYGKTGNLLRAEMYKTGNPCAKCPSNSVCSTKYQGLCEVRGDQVPLPVPSRPIVPIAPPNNNDIDIFRPSDATGM